MYCRNNTGTISHVLCREVFLSGRFKMYCRNYTGTISHVLCREVFLSGRFNMYFRNYTGTISHVLCREVFLSGRFNMYFRNYTGTVSHVLCREVYYTVSLFGRVRYERFQCSLFCFVFTNAPCDTPSNQNLIELGNDKDPDPMH